MSFNIPQTPAASSVVGSAQGSVSRKSSHTTNTKYNYKKTAIMMNTPPGTAVKTNQNSGSFLDGFIDVSDIDGFNDILEDSKENASNAEEGDIVSGQELLFSKSTKNTGDEISTEADTWIDDVFSSNLYGAMHADETTGTSDLMTNQIFLDQVSPNNDLTPDSVISPLEFSTQINSHQTSSPLADLTNVQHDKKASSSSPLTVDNSLIPKLVEALSAFIESFFSVYRQRYSLDTTASAKPNKVIPRNEYISEYLVKNYGKSYNKKDIGKILSALQQNKKRTDPDLIQLITYTDQLKAKNIKGLNSLKILSNFSNPLLSALKQSTDRISIERENSVSALNNVERLSLNASTSAESEKFELNKFKISFNFKNNDECYKFTGFDRSSNQAAKRCATKLGSIEDLCNHITGANEGRSLYLDELIRDSRSCNSFMICNAKLMLNDSSASPNNFLSKKRNFDLNLGKFVASMEILHHVPRTNSSNSIIFNHQSLISIYNKNQLIHQKAEPIIGFKVNPESKDHDTYNLKIPFQSKFWGGYLTWLLNGSDDDTIDDIVIVQKILEDEANHNDNLITLVWKFRNTDYPSLNSVEYEMVEINGKNSDDDDQTDAAVSDEEVQIGESEERPGVLHSSKSVSHVPIMNSKLISNIITGNNNSSPHLLGVLKSSHKRTRSKSFSELEHSFEQVIQDAQYPQQAQQPAPQAPSQGEASSQQAFFLHQQQQHALQMRYLMQQQQQQQQQQLHMEHESMGFPQPQFPHKLNLEFDQTSMGQGINSAPATQQSFVFYPPPSHPQQVPQQQLHSQSANNTPYMLQQTSFPQFAPPQGPPPQQQNVQFGFNKGQIMIQQPPTRFINAPGPISIVQTPQQLPTPPSSMSKQSRKFSTPGVVQQHNLAIENNRPKRATRQSSSSSVSSISSSGTIPFMSSPSTNSHVVGGTSTTDFRKSNHSNPDFKKMKSNFDQALKIEFYQPPKN